MAGNLHVRNLDEDLIARLKRRAARHGRWRPSIAKFFAKLLPMRRSLPSTSWPLTSAS